MRTLVRGGRVITAIQDYVADVLIEDEQVTMIGSFPDVQADNVVDAAGKLVFPGGIDPHTHMEIPFQGAIAADDFLSGTVAAAVGGTTTIIDFAIQQRGQDMRVSLDKWFEKSEGQTVVDWGFHQIVTDLSGDYVASMDEHVRNGVRSFKFFMAYPDALMVDDGTIFRAMERATDSGALIMIHAENGMVIHELVKRAVAEGKRDAKFHSLTRPPITEGEATARAIALAEMADSPVYIVHLSAKESLTAVREARDRGLPVYAETCPHYLLLSDDMYESPGEEGFKYVVSPPLRGKAHVEALWGGLESNDLQVISTDHAPFTAKDRMKISGGDFSKVPTGLPGVETRFSLLYHFGVSTGRMSLNEFVSVISTNAAKLFGLYPRKGDIAPGCDGDIVVFDPEREFTITAESLAGNCDFDPYEGRVLRGWPETVLLRGEVIVDKGVFVGRQGKGQFLHQNESIALG